jgi:hypothetical protein
MGAGFNWFRNECSIRCESVQRHPAAGGAYLVTGVPAPAR